MEICVFKLITAKHLITFRRLICLQQAIHQIRLKAHPLKLALIASIIRAQALPSP